MRVLHVLSSLNRISGVANVVMNYYRLLKDRVKFDFLLFAPVKDSFESEAANCGSRLFYIPKFGIRTYSSYKLAVAELFEKHKGEFDIVHIHELMSQRVIVPIAHKYGIKVVMHSHGPYPDRKIVGLVKSLRNKFLLKDCDVNSDCYLACSDVAATAFRRRNDVKILRNGVDVSRYASACESMRDELCIDNNAFVVGAIGRITQQKNPMAIIDIFDAVHKRNNNAVLVMAGEGDMLGDVAGHIDELGLSDSVKLIGNCRRVPELLRSIDAFLLPSLWEGLPVVLVEAQAAGLPCYCSEFVSPQANLTGNVEYLSLDSGCDTWANSILSGHKLTEVEVRTGFVKTGYDLAANADALLDIYSELC